MKRILSVLVLALAASAVWAAGSRVSVLKEQLKLQEALLASQLEELATHQENLQEAWVRVERESADHLRAQQQNEGLESLRLRDMDLRLAESELGGHLAEAQRLRRAVVTTRTVIREIEDEMRALQGSDEDTSDPITGDWTIVIEPGGQEGRLSLELDGTLIQGVYELDGGWRGSFRGTLVASKVRLERIDAELGFAAIFYGQLGMEGGTRRLVGRWESTQLASGLPAAGSWLAQRVKE